MHIYNPWGYIASCRAMRSESWPDLARCRRKVEETCQPEDQNVDLGTTKMIARKEGGIGWMIFNQPEKHNAVSLEMGTAVPKIVGAFETEPGVRGSVLWGHS